MTTLKDTLVEITKIGKEVTKLTERSKTLRMSLMTYYEQLPKSNQSAIVAQVVIENRLYQIKPVTKLSDGGPESKIIDVTVTYDDVFLVTD